MTVGRSMSSVALPRIVNGALQEPFVVVVSNSMPIARLVAVFANAAVPFSCW